MLRSYSFPKPSFLHVAFSQLPPGKEPGLAFKIHQNKNKQTNKNINVVKFTKSLGLYFESKKQLSHIFKCSLSLN